MGSIVFPRFNTMETATLAAPTTTTTTTTKPSSKRARCSGAPLPTHMVLAPVLPDQAGSTSTQGSDPDQSTISAANLALDSVCEASTAEELRVKQLESLQQLYDIYKAEHLQLLEHLKTKYDAFIGSGQSVLKQATPAEQPDNNPAQPAASPPSDQEASTSHLSMQQILQQHRAQLKAAANAAPAPASPSLAPEGNATGVVCSIDTSQGRGVASLNNWMAMTGGQTSAGTPQSLLRPSSTPSTTLRKASTTTGASDQPDPAPLTPIAEGTPGAPGAASKPTTNPDDFTAPTPVDANPAPATSTQSNGMATTTVGAGTAAPMDVDDAAAGHGSADAGSKPASQVAAGSAGQPQGTGGGGQAVKEDIPMLTPIQDTCNTPAMKAAQQAREAARAVPSMQTLDSVADDEAEQLQGSFSEAEDALVHVRGGQAASSAAATVTVEPFRRFAGQDLGQLLKLEALASAVTELEMDQQDALACLVGSTGRYLIQTTTVLLGRTTEIKGEVDVDLAELGELVSKVSRRQAYIILRPDGQWSFSNAGRRVVHVDGVPLAQFGLAHLQHLSLLELGGVQLMFMVNTAAVQRVLRRTQRATAA